MKLAKKHAPLSDLSSSVGSECWAWRGSHALHCKACTGSVFDFLEGSRHFWRVCSGAGLDSNLGTDNRFGAKSFLIMKTWFECLSFFPPWKWMGKRNLWWRSTLRCTSWKYLESFPVKKDFHLIPFPNPLQNSKLEKIIFCCILLVWFTFLQ